MCWPLSAEREISWARLLTQSTKYSNRVMSVQASVFVLDAQSQKHSFHSDLTTLDNISFWFSVPAHPTSDSPHPASLAAAVIPQKTECCNASLMTLEDHFSLDYQLSLCFPSEGRTQRQPVLLTSSAQRAFSFLCAAFMSGLTGVWDHNEEEPRIQAWKVNPSSPPACLMFKSRLLYEIKF